MGWRDGSPDEEGIYREGRSKNTTSTCGLEYICLRKGRLRNSIAGCHGSCLSDECNTAPAYGQIYRS